MKKKLFCLDDYKLTSTYAIDDGVTGLLASDQDDLVAKIRLLLADPDLRNDLGEKARIRAGQFSWDVTADAIAAQMALRPGAEPPA